MNVYAAEDDRLRTVNVDTYRQVMFARQEFGQSTVPTRTAANDKEENFRRNGYNRKHAYDALFDDNEQGEAADGIASIGTWHDDVSAITDMFSGALTPGVRAKYPNARPSGLTRTKRSGRGEKEEKLHVFGASRFSWHDTEDEETCTDESGSECSETFGKKRRPATGGKTLTTATVTTDTSESRTDAEKGYPSPDGNPRKWLNTSVFEDLSERVLDTPVRRRKDLRDESSTFSKDDSEFVDGAGANVTESLRNLVLSPLAACFSCETGTHADKGQKHFFDDDSLEKNYQRLQNSKKKSSRRKSSGSGNKKGDPRDAQLEEVPSWVVISS